MQHAHQVERTEKARNLSQKWVDSEPFIRDMVNSAADMLDYDESQILLNRLHNMEVKKLSRFTKEKLLSMQYQRKLANEAEVDFTPQY